MPTYEYECTKCGHTFEALQSIKDNPLSRCPECKKASLRRIVSGGMGVIFKGSGFYTTDNKKGSSLTGGNGGNGGSREKDKAPEKVAESAGNKGSDKSPDKGSDKSSSSSSSATEKKAAS